MIVSSIRVDYSLCHLRFRDMVVVNTDMGAQEGTDDQRDVFSLMS